MIRFLRLPHFAVGLFFPALVVACGSAPNNSIWGMPRSPPTTERALASTSASTSSVLPQPLDPAMEALLDELEKFSRPADQFGEQAKPIGYRRLPALGAFPFDRVARATMVTFVYGEEGAPLEADGTFSRNVYLPDADLSPSELKSVLAIMPGGPVENMYLRETKDAHGGTQQRGVPRVRCGFDAHHAVVFFDANNAPIAKILVCFTCNEWLLRPATKASGGDAPGMMEGTVPATFRAIAEAHHLAPWRFGDAGQSVREALFSYVEKRYGTEQEPTPLGEERRTRRLARGSGVDRKKKLPLLTSDERRKLCRFTSQEVRPTRGVRDLSFSFEFGRLEWLRKEPTELESGKSAADDEGYGYRCDSGSDWIHATSQNRCAERAFTCDVTVEQLEACLRVFREPADLCEPRAVCGPVLECLPFVQKVPSKP
jgi:hypothetical protein